MKIKFKQYGTPDSNVAEIDLGVSDVRITKCYTGVSFQTSGFIYGVAMRDQGLEIQVWPEGTTEFTNANKIQCVSVQPSFVEVMKGRVYSYWQDRLPETAFKRLGSPENDSLLQGNPNER